MYVLLELPFALISIYLTKVIICFIVKVMHFKVNFRRKEIIENIRDEIIKSQKNKEDIIEYKKKEVIKLLKFAIKMNITEILTISFLAITSYMTIAAIVFQFTFTEPQYLIWIEIFMLFFVVSITILLFICASDENEELFSSKNFSNRLTEYIYKLITIENISMLRIVYIIPILINIIFVLQINGIDDFFINLEKGIIF